LKNIRSIYIENFEAKGAGQPGGSLSSQRQDFVCPRVGAADPNWPDGYAAHMVAEQAGEKRPLWAMTT
jgi:hypothetical protein